MPIICVAATKGGAGKSTIASNLAVALHSSGERVAVVDADDQRSLIKWAARGLANEQDLPMVVHAGDDVRRVAREIASSYPWVIVDTPGAHDQRIFGAIGAADFVVIPVRPGAMDVEELRPALDVLAKVREIREGRPMAGILRNAWERTRIAAASDVSTPEALLMDTVIFDRTVFKAASSAGMGVTTYESGGLAAGEIKKLVHELLQQFDAEEDAA